jgi:hypothetical protein
MHIIWSLWDLRDWAESQGQRIDLILHLLDRHHFIVIISTFESDTEPMY